MVCWTIHLLATFDDMLEGIQVREIVRLYPIDWGSFEVFRGYRILIFS